MSTFHIFLEKNKNHHFDLVLDSKRFPNALVFLKTSFTITEPPKYTWMSQEVSKWLVHGLQPTYTWGVLGLEPAY